MDHVRLGRGLDLPGAESFHSAHNRHNTALCIQRTQHYQHFTMGFKCVDRRQKHTMVSSDRADLSWETATAMARHPPHLKSTAVQCSAAVQCSSVQCSALQCSAVQRTARRSTGSAGAARPSPWRQSSCQAAPCRGSWDRLKHKWYLCRDKMAFVCGTCEGEQALGAAAACITSSRKIEVFIPSTVILDITNQICSVRWNVMKPTWVLPSPGSLSSSSMSA